MPRNRKRGVGRLLGVVVLSTVIWLVVLPRVGSWGPVRAFVRGNEAAGINPSAVYYTEVEGMGAVGERLGR